MRHAKRRPCLALTKDAPRGISGPVAHPLLGSYPPPE